MTNPTPHGQVPEALRLAHIFDNPLPRNQKCVQVWVPETPKEQPHDN